MPIMSQKSDDGRTVTISVTDRFDFNVFRDFRAAYEQVGPKQASYVFDLRGASYIDSSALGMLLQVREYAGGGRESVKIKNASGTIKDILRIANFDKLMTID
jgi:anti-anti-sigma factor